MYNKIEESILYINSIKNNTIEEVENMLENNCRRAFRCCIDIVIFIISILLTFVIGVLVGGATELATVIGTGGFIVLITVFVLFIIIRVVQLLCCKIKCC